MVVESEGVVKELPLPNCVPPLDKFHHVIGSAAEAVSITIPLPQRETFEAVGAVEIELTVAVHATLALWHVVPACA